eukprot:m.317931 g.317931  ORF g.317931 m.317931 type:complete len:258 (+) comp19693_c1_seq6:97-870(+)
MRISLAFTAAVVVCFGSQAQADGPYKPTWDSLDKRPTPEWFDDAKFGIFIHWGVYSVPSWAPVGTYAEWYWAYLTGFASPPTGSVEAFQAFHNKTYGPDFKYADFARMFHAELFDPKQWVDVFEASGAKYIVPTSKHHEGFTLWKSAQSWNWNAVEIGPHRDLLKELLDEVDTRPGMRRAFYYSLYEWFHPLYRSEHPHDYVDQGSIGPTVVYSPSRCCRLSVALCMLLFCCCGCCDCCRDLRCPAHPLIFVLLVRV